MECDPIQPSVRGPEFCCAPGWPPLIGIDDRRHDDRPGPQTRYVFGDRAIAADDHAGPANEVVRLAEALEKMRQVAVVGALIGDIGRVIEIENERLPAETGQNVFAHRRAKQHGLARSRITWADRAATRSTARLAVETSIPRLVRAKPRRT